MTSGPHALGGQINEKFASRIPELKQQPNDEQRKTMPCVCEQAHVAPGIDILPGREKRNLFRADPLLELGAIAIALPADAAKQMPIARSQCDQITTAAMIRTEHKPLIPKRAKRDRDINAAQAGAIRADDNNFLVAKSRDFLRRRLQASGEGRAALLVKLKARGRGAEFRGREKMKIRVHVSRSDSL